VFLNRLNGKCQVIYDNTQQKKYDMQRNFSFRSNCFLLLSLFCFCPVSADDSATLLPYRDLHCDSWVATDSLGRSLPDFAMCGPMKKDKYIGIFYWTWHTLNSGNGPFDVTKILAENPENPKWGPVGAPHHWGEPELGYYINTDPYVIRKHASMLSDAGVDVIIFDTTNPPLSFKKSYMALCKEYQRMRHEGNRTPQIAFLAPFNDPTVLVQQVYEDLYKPNLYPDLWFRWKGKPLIMADPAYIENPEMKEFFTYRKPIPSYFSGPSGPDQWGWLEVYPQHGFYNSDNQVEQVTVGIAQNAIGNNLSFMSHLDGAMGRSWHDGKKDTSPNAVSYGLNFSEQWKRALELNPEFIFITGWNEWISLRFPEWGNYKPERDSLHPDAIFLDQYNHEYSRDIEPMKDGHTDNYYYQMISYIRQFKGMHPAPSVSPETKITIDGDFADWRDVQPEYRDTIDDTIHRDCRGYGSTYYTNTTGRNDFVTIKVARDMEFISFYVETREKITPCTDSQWMLLFIDIDCNPQTGWQGYDFLVNHTVTDESTTTLKQINANNWNLKTIGSLHYKVVDNQMELQIPRSLLGLDKKANVVFDFHWADNIQKENDIIEFAISGDSAPNRRFNYRYIGQ